MVWLLFIVAYLCNHCRITGQNYKGRGDNLSGGLSISSGTSNFENSHVRKLPIVFNTQLRGPLSEPFDHLSLEILHGQHCNTDTQIYKEKLLPSFRDYYIH